MKIEISCIFFQMLAHALQSKLNKVSISNFVKFRLLSMSSKMRQAFEKKKKKIHINMAKKTLFGN